MMPDAAVLTAAAILAIPEDQPERLFGTPDAITGCYHALAKRWHPDHAAGVKAVFSHVAILHAKACEKRDLGLWRTPGLLELAVIFVKGEQDHRNRSSRWIGLQFTKGI